MYNVHSTVMQCARYSHVVCKVLKGIMYSCKVKVKSIVVDGVRLLLYNFVHYTL